MRLCRSQDPEPLGACIQCARSFHFSQCRDRRVGAVDLLKPSDLRLGEVVIKGVTVAIKTVAILVAAFVDCWVQMRQVER